MDSGLQTDINTYVHKLIAECGKCKNNAVSKLEAGLLAYSLAGNNTGIAKVCNEYLISGDKSLTKDGITMVKCLANVCKWYV